MNRAYGVLVLGAAVALGFALWPSARGRASGSRRDRAAEPAAVEVAADPPTHERLEALGAWLGQARPAWAGEPVEPVVVEVDRPPMPLLFTGPDNPPRVDPRYLRRRVRQELTPLVVACYRAARERDPDVGGRVVLTYRVVGNRHIGGIVDDVRLLDETTVRDPELRTCVTESMMSVTFDAPPDEGEVTGVFAIDLSPALVLPAEVRADPGPQPERRRS